MYSKQWEPATSKENLYDKPSLPKAYTLAIDQSIKKALKQVDFKRRRSVNGSVSGGQSSARSDMIFHKCDKRVHIKKDCRSKVNGSDGKSPKKSRKDLSELVSKKHVVSDTNYLATATMNCKHKH